MPRGHLRTVRTKRVPSVSEDALELCVLIENIAASEAQAEASAAASRLRNRLYGIDRAVADSVRAIGSLNEALVAREL